MKLLFLGNIFKQIQPQRMKNTSPWCESQTILQEKHTAHKEQYYRKFIVKGDNKLLIHFFFLIKSSLIYEELCICIYIINKTKKEEDEKTKSWQHLIYSVSRLSLIYSIDFIIIYFFFDRFHDLMI